MSCPSYKVFCETVRILLDVANESPMRERLDILHTMMKIVVRSENVFNFSNEGIVKLLGVIKRKSDEASQYDPRFFVYSKRVKDMIGYKGPMTRSRTQSSTKRSISRS
jgi:hypothetical protein